MQTGIAFEQGSERVREQPRLPEPSYAFQEGWHQYTVELQKPDDWQDYVVRLEGTMRYATRFNPRVESRAFTPAAGLSVDRHFIAGKHLLTVSVQDGYEGTVSLERGDGAAFSAAVGERREQARERKEKKEAAPGAAANILSLEKEPDGTFLIPRTDSAPLYLRYERANGAGRLDEWIAVDASVTRSEMEYFLVERAEKDGAPVWRVTVKPAFRGTMFFAADGKENSILATPEGAEAVSRADEMQELFTQLQAQTEELNANKASLAKKLKLLSEVPGSDPTMTEQLQRTLEAVEKKLNALSPRIENLRKKLQGGTPQE